MTAPAAPYPFPVDRHGFPLVDCPRCAGAGYLPHHGRVNGGRCFKCDGGKRVHPRGRAGDLAAEFYAAQAAARQAVIGAHVMIGADGSRVTVPGVRVGDVVRPEGRDPGPWREVVAVRVGRRIVGEGYEGHPGRLFQLSLETVVGFADGGAVTGRGVRWCRRPDVAALTALRDRLAEESRGVHGATLARRGSRARRVAPVAELPAVPCPFGDLVAARGGVASATPTP